MSTRITAFCVRQSTRFPVSLSRRAKSTAVSPAASQELGSLWTETSLREKALATARSHRINELLEAQAQSLTRSTMAIHVEQEPRGVTIKWADGHESRFHATWLRANCSRNFHHPTGQRMFFPGDISPDLTVSGVTLNQG